MARDLVWFFGYGSLMWRPGFDFDAFEPARLEGWHRALCIYSHHYRGTVERPGLVLGLAEGGFCMGRAFGVAPERAAGVLAYLDERELQGDQVYDRLCLKLTLIPSQQPVMAWCYVAKPGHAQFAPGLDPDSVLRCVRQGHGIMGPCGDYVRNTLAHLGEMGIAEPALEALVEALGEAVELAP